MLYSIIPPIIVILSLAGIILFLMKKAPQVARLEEEDFDNRKEQKTIKERLKKILKVIKKGLKRLSKKIFKIVKQKIKNIFKKKRIEEIEEKKYKELIKEKKISRKVREIKQNREKIEKKLKRFFGENSEKEKTVRPIISEKIVRPRKIEQMMIEKIVNNPKDVKAYEKLGDYYLEVENWEDAKECFKQVIKLDSRNTSVKVKMRKLERVIKR